MSLPVAPLTAQVADQIGRILDGVPGEKDLLAALRLLAKWRCMRLEAEVERRSGRDLVAGPFAGMSYVVRASEGARIPRMLGVYEASLAPVIEEIVARDYATVLDIGSAEGYYAVGLARRMPGARVLARDGDPRARALCAALATANGVAARVEIGGIIDHADLALCAQAPTVVICDIEGAEVELLDPVAAPALLAADLLVEVHEGMRPGVLALLQERFARSHNILRIDRRLDDSVLGGWYEGLSDLDRLLMIWEWRSSPTPWLWMTRR